ncbi:MAG: dynamin family protein [Myxococcales bacterium]|nr:dynamin family protein [Myxococcales bacterium]
MTDSPTTISDWYAQQAATHIQEHLPNRAPIIADTLERLRRVAESAGRELPVCFLGQAGVGKSTLINALVAGSQTVLPQGGVGPLTAQATVIRHADHRFFQVRYLQAGRLNNLLFSLERSFNDRGTLPPPGPDPEAAEETRLEAELAQADPDDQSTSTKVDAYRRLAAQMVRGNQFAEVEVPYLCDRLRECMGNAPQWGTDAIPEDAERVARIASVLAEVRKDKEHTHRVEAGADPAAFHRELDIHASGFLAPLIRTLDVGWDTPLLKGGLVLVDLPGIGVANDEYRRVTSEWIRKARAVVLVVDRAGVTDASVDLLRTTGFLNSMLHESLSGEDADPPILMVSVVKVDLQATDARTKDRQLHGKAARRWVEHFDEHCSQLVSVIRGQMQTELAKTVADGGDQTLSSREEVMESLLANLKVHPLSAHEYRLLLEDDEDERPHISDLEQSKVPGFGRDLREVVELRERRLQERLSELREEAAEKTSAALRMIHAQWQQEDRAAEDAERLRQDLDVVAKPLRDNLLRRQGAFRSYLRDTIPVEIEKATLEASEEARAAINKYLKRLRKYHWATIRAAVRRGGTFVGSKHVDIPNELTLRFEEPVAVVWDKKILQELRRRTREMGDDYVSLVGEIVEWTRGQGTRVKPELVEALHDNLKADTRDLGRIGRDAVSELKEAVKAELFDEVNNKVARRCKRFVESRKDIGTGVQARMHELLEELADDVVKYAQPAAIKVLTTNYREVDEEITKAFGAYPNPIDQSVDAIVSDHEMYRRRSDAQRRRHVIARTEELLEQLGGIAPAAEA